MEVRLKSKEWLILNAVKAWLFNYENKETELTPQYQQLHRELYNAYITKDTTVQKRGRPAKRQRKKAATSIASSKETSQTT
tara:strand:- start:196 stop:438 length:243 start_codon:yes stop_codon:yes gene_type:complete